MHFRIHGGFPHPPPRLRPIALGGSAFRIALAVAALLVASARSVHAQVPDAPFYASRIDEILARYDAADSPGCAIAVVRDGVVEFAKGYGSAHLELGAPVTTTTVFNAGSITKQFTAISILMLEAEGRLSLDDELRRHVPELPDYSKAGGNPTIRHCLGHVSGLRDIAWLFVLGGRDLTFPAKQSDVLAVAARQRAPNFPPGERYLYSNTGYDLMAVVVERLSGRPLGDFARERVFEPLGMRDTRLHDDPGRIVPGRAAGYAPQTDLKKVKFGAWQTFTAPFYVAVGGGGLLTTAEDLSRWESAILAPPPSFSSLFARMSEPGTLNDGSRTRYGMGLELGSHRGLRMIGHDGLTYGYSAKAVAYPGAGGERGLAIVVLANLSPFPASRIAREIADIVLEKELAAAETAPGPTPWPAAPPNPDALEEAKGEPAHDAAPAPNGPSAPRVSPASCAGTWRSDELDVEYVLRADGDDLRCAIPSWGELRARRTAPDAFTMKHLIAGDVTLRFFATVGTGGPADASPARMILDSSRASGIVFDRAP